MFFVCDIQRLCYRSFMHLDVHNYHLPIACGWYKICFQHIIAGTLWSLRPADLHTLETCEKSLDVTTFSASILDKYNITGNVIRLTVSIQGNILYWFLSYLSISRTSYICIYNVIFSHIFCIKTTIIRSVKNPFSLGVP